MKKLILFSIPFILALVSSCGDSGKCASEITWYGNEDSIPYSRLDGPYREFIYEDESAPSDICPDEHVTATFIAQANNSSDVEVRGKAYWSVYGEQVVMGNYFDPNAGGEICRGNISDIGLKQAFPSGAGYIGLQIIYRFLSKGGENIDRAYIDSVFPGKGYATLKYHKQKF